MTVWSDEDHAAVRKSWAEGLSASQIGRQLHRTRNSIIGKIHRLGLGGRSQLNRSYTKAPKPRKPKPIAAPKLNPVKMTALRAELQLIAMMAPTSTFADAQPGRCRYMNGDPKHDTSICGRATAGGPWCVCHRKLVYTPRRPRARVRSAESDELRRQVKMERGW